MTGWRRGLDINPDNLFEHCEEMVAKGRRPKGATTYYYLEDTSRPRKQFMVRPDGDAFVIKLYSTEILRIHKDCTEVLGTLIHWRKVQYTRMFVWDVARLNVRTDGTLNTYEGVCHLVAGLRVRNGKRVLNPEILPTMSKRVIDRQATKAAREPLKVVYETLPFLFDVWHNQGEAPTGRVNEDAIEDFLRTGDVETYLEGVMVLLWHTSGSKDCFDPHIRKWINKTTLDSRLKKARAFLNKATAVYVDEDTGIKFLT